MISGTLTTSIKHRFRAAVLALAAVVAIALPAPVFAQNRSCAADAPGDDPSVNASLLPTFNQRLGPVWTPAAQAPGGIDPLTGLDPIQATEGCDLWQLGIAACGSTIIYPVCEHVTFNAQLDQIIGLSDLAFSDTAAQAFNHKEVAQHTQSGPDAGKIVDGVFAPEGESWNHPSYTVVLTSGVTGAQFQNALLQSALTIDFGSPIQVCTSSQCGGATVQADRHSLVLEYSTDGTTWTNYGTVAYKDSTGLRTRPVTLNSSLGGQPVTARYVRVYGRDDKDGDYNYAISEVALRSPQGTIISIDKRAIGPRPYQITDGNVAPDGTSWNNPNYAAVLRGAGEAHALVIDLGQNITICGSTSCGPTVQADRHPFQFDVSADGINWVSYSQLPAVSGDGLRPARSLQPIVDGKDNPDFTARFIRLYGLPADDDNYSISEVRLRNTAAGNPVVSTGKLTYGAEALATDGEVAPEGAEWNNSRYATILSPCGQSSSTVCAHGSRTGVTGALRIDLGGVFTLESIVVQADRHEFQVDYRASETDAWQQLWTVPSTGGSGLRTRPAQPDSGPQARQPLGGQEARYLMVYGTAGDDLNYSVSSVQVYTQAANTPCSYDSGANRAQQAASCSYEGPTTTHLSGPAGESQIPISFIIQSAEAHYHCTSDFGSTNIPVVDGSIPDGTVCTANLELPQAAPGQFCSASCDAGTTPASVLTHVGIAADLTDPTGIGPTFTLKDLSCNHSTGNLTDSMMKAVAATASVAVGKLFGALVVSPLTTPTGQPVPPMIPSGTCKAPSAPPTNTRLSGSATHVGKASDAGQVSLSGTVSAPGAVPLDTLALRLDRVLYESGGVEELVRSGNGASVAPLTLLPQKGSQADRAVFATAPGVTPIVRAEVRRQPQGQLVFALVIHRAHLPTVPTCTGAPSPSVSLATGFSLGAIGGPWLDVHALQDWQCEGEHRLVTQ